MKGKIIKGIAGFYYVHAGDALHSADGIYECKAKGVFRKDHRKPLVGDDVEMEVIDEAQKKGNITELLPRHSELIRPRPHERCFHRSAGRWTLQPEGPVPYQPYAW